MLRLSEAKRRGGMQYRYPWAIQVSSFQRFRSGRCIRRQIVEDVAELMTTAYEHGVSKQRRRL